MESIDNMGKKSLEMLAKDNLTEEGKKDLGRELICAAISLALLGAGLLFSYIFPAQATIPPLLYTIAFIIQAAPIFAEAIGGVIHRNMEHSLEILVAIAIVSCYLTGELIMAVTIPLILNIVHILEERSIMGGREVIEGLRKMQQGTAVLLDGDKEMTVEASTLKIGDRILVKPGTGIPIDGVIVSGDTHIDQKSLTGEPLPVHAKEGDPVYAGTVNIEGRIVVEVRKEYVDTSFSKILQLLENSENIASSETQIIDRFLKYYIPFVLGLAGAIALIQKDMTQAIAVLVVSCPCGQMLVSSAPMIAALSVATKHGILIKNSKFIEELTEVDAVVFDKTGTLTVGDLQLVANMPYENAVTQDELLIYAATVASASNHPISRAVMSSAINKEYDKTYDIKEISGKGVRGVSQDGAHTILFGNRDWIFAETGTPSDSDFAKDLKIPSSYVAFDGKLCGVLGFNDVVRPMAKRSLEELRQLGVEESVMLTGDGQTSAQVVCDEIGIDTLHAKLLPEDKLNHLRQLKEDRVVLAVGDGINDALALREADIGIAMGAMGSDMAIESADIALMNNNLRNIPFVVKLARKTKRIVYQNLVMSIVISLIMIALSAFGLIPAVLGSVMHNVGAFVVLINSSRILRMNRED